MRSSPPSPDTPTPNPATRRKVLIVEDETALRRTYSRFFKDRYDLAFAANGTEARRQLEEFDPEVLVLDLRLPDTDGVTLLQEIRRSRPSLPVIVTTAYVSMEPLIDVLDLGHSGYLIKPFDIEDLAAHIEAVP
jgi:DNA-binding response OmpR family regulator